MLKRRKKIPKRGRCPRGTSTGPGVAAASSTTRIKDSGAADKRKSSPRRIPVYRPPQLKIRREPGRGALSEIQHYQQAGGLIMC
jgi:hypothetical protein